MRYYLGVTDKEAGKIRPHRFRRNCQSSFDRPVQSGFVNIADRAASSESTANIIIPLNKTHYLTPNIQSRNFAITSENQTLSDTAKIRMSSTLTFEIAHSLFHWMRGDISPQVLAAKLQRTSSTASVSSSGSSMSDGVEILAFAERRSRVRHRKWSSGASGRAVRGV
ncbi:hypothetical protein P171DRAFT_135936 [Karstenula rhodostoma CBS 690.94]|uniref:Uncharacterized protein n=1 Tax=Karstenula rhodostoma CBS 690.94 TaxID=1392251 RepID=A0A9P4PTW8_9PLEO|nr:hypothetical protein P171DRAFT_135936 [Karstenula rhodostoma CBS 690.94]